MKCLVLGGNGQLGTDLVEELCRRGHQVDAPSRLELDLAQVNELRRAIEERQCQIVFNAAACVGVDACEEQCSIAWTVNSQAVYQIARACRATHATLVQFSTDYVFGGGIRERSCEPLREGDPPSPLNVYGVTKLAGEHMALAYAPRALVIRSAGLYGGLGAPITEAKPFRPERRPRNFVEAMLSLGAQGRDVRVVDDQRLTPTATADLARVSVEALEREVTGLLHVTNTSSCSWFEFARTIFNLAGFDVDLKPTSSEDYGASAKRPHYSVLSMARLVQCGIDQPRSWRDALQGYWAQRRRLGWS